VGMLTLVPGGSSVDTHREVVVTVARLKLASIIVGGHVP
jgi:hypothetical protein